MDVRIGEVQSTVRVADGQALLSPRVLDQIVRAVLERLRAEREREQRVERERQARPRGAREDEKQSWA